MAPSPRGRLDRHTPSWQESRRWAAVDRDVLIWKWRGMPREAKRAPLGAATTILNEVTDEAVLECATGQMLQLSDVVTMMVRNLQVQQSDGSWLEIPGVGVVDMRVPDDAPPPQTRTSGNTWTMSMNNVWPETIATMYGVSPYAVGLASGITWPDEGYPCQVCWAVGRWPWEPSRACPIGVPVESTYCAKHR